MKKSFLFLGACVLMLNACSSNGTTESSANTTSTEDSVVTLQGDAQINKAIKFYAGITRDGIEMSESDKMAWDDYSKNIKNIISQTDRTREMIDSISRTDFADFRDSIDFVLYPFSAADFLYAASIYPDADTYFLCGLEKTGTPIGANVVTTYSHFKAYRDALQYYFRSTYFLTNGMKTEFHNNELDGVCPVITMLMALNGREIISIEKKDFDANGNVVAAQADKGNVLEIKFFKPGKNKEQLLYYVSGDASDSGIDVGMKKYLENTLPKHKVGSYLKAASYLCHNSFFSVMRDFVVNNSYAVVEDDSGIPYRYFANDYDVTVYGKYQEPLPLFGHKYFQDDLNKLYKEDPSKVKNLPFLIGYNRPSNWMCARRKK